MKRLPPSVFKIPADKLRAGYYTDRYFLRTRDVLINDERAVSVGYQFFPRKDAIVCGLDEAVSILKTCSGFYRNPRRAEVLYRRLKEVQWNLQDASARQDDREMARNEKTRTEIRRELNGFWQNCWKELKVFSLEDGAGARENDPVLMIFGDPRYFVHLETPLLGAIARPTSIATNVRQIVRAAGRKPILFFSARFDHYWVQATDGYAALKGGAFGVSTDANADYWGIESVGTVPHFLIGCYGGNTAEAMLAFDRYTPAEVKRIALVDWDNDCIGTTRRVLTAFLAKALGLTDIPEGLFLRKAKSVVGEGRGKLWGIRLDTSADLKDRSVRSSKKSAYGVSAELVRSVRRALDRWGCRRLKIVASGGFDADKIRRFEASHVPVDAYGVGSALVRNRIDITADIVEYDGRSCAKIGRRMGARSRLERVV